MFELGSTSVYIRGEGLCTPSDFRAPGSILNGNLLRELSLGWEEVAEVEWLWPKQGRTREPRAGGEAPSRRPRKLVVVASCFFLSSMGLVGDEMG